MEMVGCHGNDLGQHLLLALPREEEPALNVLASAESYVTTGEAGRPPLPLAPNTRRHPNPSLPPRLLSPGALTGPYVREASNYHICQVARQRVAR